MEKTLPELGARGVRVVTVSVDPPDVTARLASKQDYTFPMLSDTRAEVVRRFDLLHAGERGGADIARPAEFLIDPSGVVRWRDLTEDYKVRVTGQRVLAALDTLGVAAAPAQH